MKKLASLLLALVMIMSCFSAMAAKVTNATTHPYTAYQIFTATQAADGSALGDVKWGNGIEAKAADFLDALKSDERFLKDEANIFASCETALDVADALSGVEDDSTIAKAFADVAAKYVVEGTGTTIEAGATSENLSTGYYLVVDVSNDLTNNDAYNAALLQVVADGDFTIAKKYDVPKVDKSVDNVDANIGDKVTFTLTATMPSTFEGYETYKVIFKDTLSASLTYNKDAKVTIADKDVTSAFTVTYADEKPTELTISCNNVLASEVGATISSEIVVTYTATVNASAEIGNPGNTNKVVLEYSNNPNWNGDGTTEDEPTGETPEDTVYVFTYELDVTKADGIEENATKLADAEFVLYREVTTVGATEATTEYVQVNTEGKVTGWTTDKTAASTLKSDVNGLFKVIGLDTGIYFLEETKAPAGYNLLIDPIQLEIKAEYKEETIEGDNDVIEVTKLEITVGESTTAGDKDTGIVGTTVVNKAGATLPETGGMGTTILYVGGGILVLAAIVLLIVKRRASAE